MKPFYYVFFIFLISCQTPAKLLEDIECSNYYRDYRYEYFPQTRYATIPDMETVQGVRVDTSGKKVSLSDIDRLVNEVEICLGTPIKRCAFSVKIAPDYKVSCYGVEVFSCPAVDQNACGGGLGCPCGCTGTYQFPSTVVTTPSLASLKHELVHLVTKKSHGDPVFKCEK